MKPSCGLFQCRFNLPRPCEQLTFAAIIPCVRTSASYINHVSFFLLHSLFKPVCYDLLMCLSHLAVWKQRLLFLHYVLQSLAH